MERILYVEDDQNQVRNIIASLGSLMFPLSKEEVLRMSPRLGLIIKENKKFDLDAIYKYLSTDDLYKRANKKFTENHIIIDVVTNCKDAKNKFLNENYNVVILDGNVSDGSTEQIFKIFKSKEIILPYSNSFGFLEKAARFGFKNIFTKESIRIPKESDLLKKIVNLLIK